MGKKDVKGENPKNENRCPVCGRFASKRVIDAHQSMMSEVERTQRTEIARLTDLVERKNASLKEACHYKKAYDELLTMYNELNDELNKLRVENEHLRERSFFARVFNW